MVAAIERGFPTKELSVLAELESWRKEVNRLTYHMHKWWATRLGSVTRAILIGALSEAETDIWNSFYDAVSFPDKVVLDPFMGAGTTIGEALKLGCTAIGADINPVSTFQVRKAIEPVDTDELKEAFQRVEDKVKLQIQSQYQTIDPETGLQAEILYCFWVMTVPCPHCDASVDLFDTTIFAKNAYPRRVPDAQSICLHCGNVHTIRYDSTLEQCPSCQQEYNPQIGNVYHDVATCPSCTHYFKIAQAFSGSENPPTYRMYALLILTSDGSKKYIRAGIEDIARYNEIKEYVRTHDMLLPKSGVAPGHNTNQMLKYNYRQWRQLFNTRQQYCLSLLLQAILEEPNKACRELLLLLFSGTLEYNNMFCSYKGEGTGAVRPLFSHHILKPERMALENVVWGTSKSSGCFSTLFYSRLCPALAYRQEPFELQAVCDGTNIKGEKVFGLSNTTTTLAATNFPMLNSEQHKALLLCTDSAHLDLPDQSVDVVITDPPYFDFVHYSELADFFFAWLRLSLERDYEEFRGETTRNLLEVQQKEATKFSLALKNVFLECRRVLKPEGLLVFSFHHSRNEGWEAVGKAIIDAGLEVVAAHPVKAEMSGAAPKSQSSSPINYDAILVCKHHHQSQPLSLENALALVSRNTKNKLRSLQQANLQLSDKDKYVIQQAEALCIFSCHAGQIRSFSGSSIALSEFLDGTQQNLTLLFKAA